MKKIIFLACCVVLILSACSKSKENSVTINNKIIKVEIADTIETQFRGLSNREELCADCGMLFVLPDKKVRTFVMRDMNFPLDFIWIDDDKIVKIDKDAKPEGSNPVIRFSSEEEVSYVLEVNAGFCEDNNIEVGNSVKFYF